MSSTNRGKKRNRQDNYPTPAWCVHRLLEKVDLPRGKWIEPGCGNGDIIRAVDEYEGGGVFDDVIWHGFDVRETPFLKRAVPQSAGRFKVASIDDKGLTLGVKRYDVCMGNPPFSRAMDFIEFGRKRATVTALLLRLNYVGTADRHEFMTMHPPDLYVLPNRPSFTKNGNTDSIEYAWFVWDHNPYVVGGKTRPPVWKLLDLTPKAER